MRSKNHVMLWTGARQGDYHPVKFGGHRRCGSGDQNDLVCHVISQDHMIKGSCDFTGHSMHWGINPLPKTPPPYFLPSPLLNLQTVQAPPPPPPF